VSAANHFPFADIRPL